MHIGISTGGGDAPGLNAVIRAVVLSALGRGWRVTGIRKGFGGLLGAARMVPLDRESVRGITHLGGTILGTTNRGDPFRWPVLQTDGQSVEVDRSDELIEAFHRHNLDALIAVGGDGTLHIANELGKKGLPIVGIPKTIDNDVGGTDVTFGFDTAVSTATEAIDKLHSTAESHQRVMVVEVMGRHAGWIALHAGLASTADVILIPEIPFHWDCICEKVRQREAIGRHFSIVVVAEGAVPVDGATTIQAAAQIGGVERLGGICVTVADQITKGTGKETRSLALGHLQRGGSPTTFDRLLALRFGAEAVRAVAEQRFNHMVAFSARSVATVPIERAFGAGHQVPPDCDQVQTARELGICLGDPAYSHHHALVT